MTEKEARAILSRPLVFGDPEQIRAVRFVEKLELGRERLAGCHHEELALDCECFQDIDPEVLEQLKLEV